MCYQITYSLNCIGSKSLFFCCKGEVWGQYGMTSLLPMSHQLMNTTNFNVLGPTVSRKNKISKVYLKIDFFFILESLEVKKMAGVQTDIFYNTVFYNILNVSRNSENFRRALMGNSLDIFLYFDKTFL